MSAIKRNLSLLLDFYELTMANGFIENGLENTVAWYDMFFRSVPDAGGYAIMAGVEQLAEQLETFHFTGEDLDYLKSKGVFSKAFLDYLADFKFSCDVWAIREGQPIFPNEPMLTVRGPIIQAQLIETLALLTINHQSLIATKASRIVRAAKGRPVMEFGSRRAQGYDGAIYGARAAYIGGCASTACALAEASFGIPAVGTMAHSWVQLFDTELEAFRTFAKVYPEECTLLVDTYNVLHSGLPNAITVFKELSVSSKSTDRDWAIRIDSGDITYLSRKARTMLDQAGLQEVKIVASNSLDEHIIRDILLQEAKVDSFGVGERLVTSRSEPVFGGVYKLVAVERDGVIHPKIKQSENVTKITNPHAKELWRLYDRDSGMALADLITIRGEKVEAPYEIFHPEYIYKRKLLENFVAVPMLEPLFTAGKRVGAQYTLKEIQDFCKQQQATIWDEVKRFENPHAYYVDLSQELYDCKQSLLGIRR